MADSTEYQIVPEAAEATATEDPPSSYTACHNHGSDVQVHPVLLRRCASDNRLVTA